MRTPEELDLLRKRAVILRRQGKSRSQIKQILGPMSNSTLNDALKDEPLPPERAGPGYAESRRRASAVVQRYWAAERATREGRASSGQHCGRGPDWAADGPRDHHRRRNRLLVRRGEEQAIPDR